MLEFCVLGPLEVRDEGRPVELRGSKRRAVLALLVLHANQVVRRDRLIRDLWGEHPPAHATAALHNHVSRLRKALGDDVLVTKPGGYELRTDPDAVDLRRFESLLAEAKPLPARERKAKLAEALGLWRGPALADLGEEPALEVDTACLEEQRLSAIEQRIDADLELGAHEELLPELEALVGEHPLSERLRGQLILALYRSGRQAEALEAYRETRHVLVEELGIEPGADLRELEQAILRQDPALASAPLVRPPPLEAPAAAPSRRRRRSSWLVPAVALLLLAGAGAAVAMVVTRGGASQPADHTSAAVAALLPPPPVTVVKSIEKAANRSTRVAHRKVVSRPHAAVRRGRPSSHVSRASVIGRTTAHPSKAQHPSGGSQTQTSTTKPQGPLVYWLADDFTDPWFDVILWNATRFGSGLDAAERNGRLEYSVAQDGVPDGEHGFYEDYATNCLVDGDFDAVVQYQLLDWPDQDGLRMTLGASFPGQDGGWLEVERAGGQTDGTAETYASNIGGRARPRTEDTSGALRLTRKDGLMSAYYRYHSSWIRLGSEDSPGPASLVIALDTAGSASAWGGQAALAAFDNFKATADSVDCHGAPPPPRKRRS